MRMKKTYYELMVDFIANNYREGCKETGRIYNDSLERSYIHGMHRKLGSEMKLTSDGWYDPTQLNAIDLTTMGMNEKEMKLAELLGSNRTNRRSRDMMSLYCSTGMKTFHVSEGLISELSSTDPSGPAVFLRPPYTCAYFALEKPIHYSGYEDAAGATPFIGYFVTQMQTAKQGKHLLISPMCRPTELIGMPLVFAIPESIISDEKLVVDRKFIEGTVLSAVKNLAFEQDDASSLALMCNILMYLNSNGADISAAKKNVRPKIKSKKRKKIKKANNEFSALSETEYFDLGRSIKINKDIPVSKEHTGASFKYSYKFTVRGHFRNQACGKDRKDRKLIWIRPHYKGPDKAALVHRNYVVKKEA